MSCAPTAPVDEATQGRDVANIGGQADWLSVGARRNAWPVMSDEIPDGQSNSTSHNDQLEHLRRENRNLRDQVNQTLRMLDLERKRAVALEREALGYDGAQTVPAGGDANDTPASRAPAPRLFRESDDAIVELSMSTPVPNTLERLRHWWRRQQHRRHRRN